MEEDIHRHKYRPKRLPHWDFGEVSQTITYRLADSLPQSVYDEIRYNMLFQPETFQESYKRKMIEEWLHGNRYGSCVLQNPIAAQIVIEAWYFYDGKWYDLYDWVVMSNHVHLMIRQYDGKRLGDIVSAWKGFTSKEISKKLNHSPNLWREGYWDRVIRDAEHFQRAKDYILKNPEKAGLTDWPYVSSKYSEGGRPRPPQSSR